jgi:DNA replication protein DnaC
MFTLLMHQTLLLNLKRLKAKGVLQRLKSKFRKYDLIILDELGYISFDKESVELLSNFISDKCEQTSTTFTTNLPFDRWNEIFHGSVITAAIVDRITHKSYVINRRDINYRLQESKEFLKESAYD